MDNEIYRTKDLGEASALVTVGFKVIRLEKHEDGKSYFFIFEKNEEIEKTASKFWNSDLSVDANSFMNSLRSLKDRIFAQ